MADSDTCILRGSEVEKLPLKPTATDQSSNYPVLFSILQTNLDLKVAIT